MREIISAAKARAIADKDIDSLLSSVEKNIETAATKGKYNTNVRIGFPSDMEVNKLCRVLRNVGYEVEIKELYDPSVGYFPELIVGWDKKSGADQRGGSE